MATVNNLSIPGKSQKPEDSGQALHAFLESRMHFMFEINPTKTSAAWFLFSQTRCSMIRVQDLLQPQSPG